MGAIHNMISRGNWSAAIKKALGVTKSEGGIERFGETLTPVIDLWRRPEFQFLRDETLWGKFAQQAAVVAEFAVIAIANPANSGRLVVVERVSARNLVATASVNLAPTTQAAVAATLTFANTVVRDTRSAKGGPQTLAVPEFWFGSDPASLIAGGFTLERINSPTAEVSPLTVALPYIIPPGFALIAEGGAVNQGIEASWAGYVRVLFPGELA